MILLADILPTLIIKLIGPWFVSSIPYWLAQCVCVYVLFPMYLSVYVCVYVMCYVCAYIHMLKWLGNTEIMYCNYCNENTSWLLH